MKKKRSVGGESGVAASIAAEASNVVQIVARPVADPGVFDRESVFREASHQARPLAEPGSGLADRTLKLVQNGNARHPILSEETARRLITEGCELTDLVKGRYASSTPAEVVVAHDFKAQNSGGDAGIVNHPSHRSPNVVDVRVAPDCTGRRDILFLIEDPKKGLKFYKSGGQVKTGAPDYVTRTLERLPEKLDYGQTAYVDTKYVNADGTPRVAPDAFSKAQARRLQKSGVRLRGVKDLERRADQLVQDIKKAATDGLSPESRAQLQQLRDDIARSYRGPALAGRVAGGAAIAAASAAILTLLVQAASGGEIQGAHIRDAAVNGGLVGAGGALAEAGIHRAATQAGAAPELARTLAQQGVAAGFCLIAVGTDVRSEVAAARRGDVSVAGAASGSCAKAALDLLPLVLAPLGFWGVPVLLGAQLGGRWVISRLRAKEEAFGALVVEDLAAAVELHSSLDQMLLEADDMKNECDSTDAIFRSVMAGRPSLLAYS